MQNVKKLWIVWSEFFRQVGEDGEPEFGPTVAPFRCEPAVLAELLAKHSIAYCLENYGEGIVCAVDDSGCPVGEIFRVVENAIEPLAV